MTIVAHTHQFFVGVDTHARSHAVSILACPNGEPIDQDQFPATAAGLSRAVSWAGRRTGGDLDTLWVIEGTGTHGARLARAATDAGYTVVEAPRMNARAARGIGKSYPLDARRIAAAALPLQPTQLRQPRADDGIRAAVKVLLVSRDHMSTERTATINVLTALLRIQRPRDRRTPPSHRGTDRHDRRLADTRRRPRHRRPLEEKQSGWRSVSPPSTMTSRTSPNGSPTSFARAPLACSSTSPASAQSPLLSR